MSYFHHSKELGSVMGGERKAKKICERIMDQWEPNLAITIQLGFHQFFRHHQLFDQMGFQRANPTRLQSPASVLRSRRLVLMQPFVAGGVPVPSVTSPLFGASGAVLQHQPVGAKSKSADNLIFTSSSCSLHTTTIILYDFLHFQPLLVQDNGLDFNFNVSVFP